MPYRVIAQYFLAHPLGHLAHSAAGGRMGTGSSAAAVPHTAPPPSLPAGPAREHGTPFAARTDHPDDSVPHAAGNLHPVPELVLCGGYVPCIRPIAWLAS